MLKKFGVALGVSAGVLMAVSSTANASVVLYDNFVNWSAAIAGTPTSLDLSAFGSTPVGLAIPVGTNVGPDINHSMTFDIPLVGMVHPGNWPSWSGTFTGTVLFTNGANSATGTFNGGGGPTAFGLEMEPNNPGLFNLTFAAGGQSETLAVDGAGGAKFFGYVSDVQVNTFTLSSDPNASGFGFGNIYYSAHEGNGNGNGNGNATPEPASMILFTLGGAGLALRRLTAKKA